jgi:hypothetical protein
MIPLANNAQLSKILLGTTLSPGKATLSNHERKLDWETKKAKGQKGATTVLNGIPPGEFDVTFELSGDEIDENGTDDFSLWDAFEKLIWSTINGPQPVALPIYHPDLARNMYTEVVLRSMGGMDHDGLGGARVKVRFGEHAPAKAKPSSTAKPAPAGKNSGTAAKPDPNAARKKELAALLAEANEP